MAYKFDDCRECKWRRSKKYCEECDYGEFFEDKDVETVDRVFSQEPRMFGETVSDETSEARINIDRFAEDHTGEDEVLDDPDEN